MPNGSGLDELERYLAGAAVLDVATFQTQSGHAHPTYRLILEGAVAVLQKPADAIGDGELVVRREVAAWAVAREIGWPDLVAATVLRRLRSPSSGNVGDASLQVIWSDCLPDAPPEGFPSEDIWRAAVFDAVVGQTDRAGHNWLAVPQAGQPPRLKLIDHGYAFTETQGPPSSAFYELRRGQLIPEDVMEPLRSFVSALSDSALHQLLPAASVDALRARTGSLESSGVLQLP